MRTLFPIFLSVIVAANLNASEIYTPISFSGMNQDIVVGINDPTNNLDGISESMDGLMMPDGTLRGGQTWMQVGVDPAHPTSGLPTGLVTSLADTNHTFQLPNSYSDNSNNALLMPNPYSVATATTMTVTLTTPQAYSSLSFLNAASFAEFGLTVSYDIHHLSGADDLGTFISYDWIGGGCVAVNCNERITLGGNSYPPELDHDVGDWNLYQSDISLLNPSPVTSIDFSVAPNSLFGGEGNTAIFAISGVAVPEPSTIALLVAGAIGLIGWVWRKRKQMA